MARQVFAGLGTAFASLVLILVLSGPSSAAQGCYPPPCSQPQVTVARVVTGVDPVLLPGGAPARSRTAAPLVAAGLLAVMATLTALCLQRRATLVVRVGDVPAVGDAGLPGRSHRQEHASSLP